MSLDQANKLFDRRFGAQIALNSISSELKAEFSEAGAIPPLERSINHLKNLKRLSSLNQNIKKPDPSTCENSEDDLTYDEYGDESNSEEDDKASQGTLVIKTCHFMAQSNSQS